MIPRTVVPEDLIALARRQGGVLSREQSLAFGVSDRVVDRLVRQASWRRVTPGIYALGEDSWLQRAWAGVLLGGPRAVLGEQAAGYLQGIVRTAPERITVFVGPDARICRDDRWRFVRSDRLGIGEPARTRVPQTVVDLCRSLDADQVTALIAEVVGSRRTRPQDILSVIHQTTRLPHRRLLTEILAEVADGVDSPLERRYLHAVERAHGLPRAERRVRPAARFLSDAWYRSYGVLVELDGDAYHRGLARSTDMTRDNVHRLAGLTTLRYTWAHVVGDPCGVARQVGLALRERGWPGAPRACARCIVEDFAP